MLRNFASVSLVGVLGFLFVETSTLAQTTHGSHHHLMVGRDNLETLVTGSYAGLANPNYNRLSLLFPHQHEPVAASHFHAIGVYSYTGSGTDVTQNSTSSNNRLPEIRYNLPPIPLFPSQGKWVSQATEQHIYSDLKTKPVHHLLEDIRDPYVAAIYNTGNGRWNALLGDEATIALELISLSPGLTVADAQGEELFSQGETVELMGVGDDFTFTPQFSVDAGAPRATYSATFRLVDLNESNGRTPWLPSGTFTLDFAQAAIPEPSSLTAIALVGLCLLGRKFV